MLKHIIYRLMLSTINITVAGRRSATDVQNLMLTLQKLLEPQDYFLLKASIFVFIFISNNSIA